MKFLDLFKKLLDWLDLTGRCEVDYISGGEALPAPLTAEEEAEVAARLAGGDDNARLELLSAI